MDDNDDTINELGGTIVSPEHATPRQDEKNDRDVETPPNVYKPPNEPSGNNVESTNNVDAKNEDASDGEEEMAPIKRRYAILSSPRCKLRFARPI